MLSLAKLDEILEVAARQLDDRYNFQKTTFAKQFPLLMTMLWTGCENLRPDDTIAPVINQGTLGIGFIGLAEALVALTGKHHGEDAAAQALGLRIITYMRDRANEFSERYHHNYSILATPAEGLSGKFTAKDRKEFGVIPGVTDREYYTNSNHVPVYYRCSPKHKAEVESPVSRPDPWRTYLLCRNRRRCDAQPAGHHGYCRLDGQVRHRLRVGQSQPQPLHGVRIRRCSGVARRVSSVWQPPYRPPATYYRYLVGATDRWNHAKLAELHDRVVHR